MATIRYTLDGSDPTPTHGFIYTGPFEISESLTVKAMVYGDGLEDSEITEVLFTITEEEPEPEEPETEGECAPTICLTPTEATPTCILPVAPTVVCLTPAEPTSQCGNDRQEDECPEGATGEPLFIAANTYFAENVEAANVLAQAALDALRAATPCVWENEEQECCNTCPEGTAGDPICVTIEAGDPRFTSTVSQEAANAAAMAQACADAVALRVLTPCVEDADCVYTYLDEDMDPSGYDISDYWSPSTDTFVYAADVAHGENILRLEYNDYSATVVPGAGGISGFENVWLFKKNDWLYTPADCGNVVSIDITATLSTSLTASSEGFACQTRFVIIQGSNYFVADKNPDGINNPPFSPNDPIGATAGPDLSDFVQQFSSYFMVAASQYFNRYNAAGIFQDNTGPDVSQPMQFGFMFYVKARSIFAYPIKYGLKHFEITINI